MRDAIMNKIEVSGYEFIEIGEFVKYNNPLAVKFDGKTTQISVELILHNKAYKNVGESVYVVTVSAIPKYVGEYSSTLENRWLRKENYIWHNHDENILTMLNSSNTTDVRLYLIENPYVVLSNGKELNISKSIEHDILQDPCLELWNTRNRKTNKINSIKLTDINHVNGEIYG